MEKTGGAALSTAPEDTLSSKPPPALIALGEPPLSPSKLKPTLLGTQLFLSPWTYCPRHGTACVSPAGHRLLLWKTQTGNARLHNRTVGRRGENVLGSQAIGGSRQVATNRGSTSRSALVLAPGNTCQFSFSSFTSPRKFKGWSSQGQGFFGYN